MGAAWRGGRPEWEELFRFYGPLARRVAQGILGTPDGAEDAVQEAAAAVYARARSGERRFETVEHARNYFLRAVHNSAVSVGRRRSPSAEPELAALVPSDRPGPDEAAANEERQLDRARWRRVVESALEELRPAEREAVLLRFRDGLTFRVISGRTGTPISTLQARVEAALGKLRRRIGKPAGEA